MLMLVYAAAAIAWAYLSFRHWNELVTLQHMMSFMMGFLVIDVLFQWLLYRYYNDHALDLHFLRSLDGSKAVTFTARALIMVTTVLDAARNSTSFFLLLIVSMGYGVVRPTIGSLMKRAAALAVMHFVFGVLYSVGIVLYIMEVGSTWTFFLILPLSLTLSTFMVWTLVSLSSTINYLETKHQTYKYSMFRKLYRILMGAAFAMTGFLAAVIIVVAVFNIDVDASNTWRYRWFALDGILGVIYLTVFLLIAWIWRPTGQNMRLAMSDELATDENDAGDFEVQSIDGDDDAVEIGTEHLQHTPAKDERERRTSDVFRVDDDEHNSHERSSFDEPYKGSFDEGRDDEYEPSFRKSYDGDDVEHERLQLSDEDLHSRGDIRLH